MDDNFATIVAAVKEGRGIYDNIRKAVHFLLSCNLGEILTVFLAMIFWRESPLLPMQLLWINLVTDSLPALALGVEPVEDDVMSRKPRSRKESLFADGVGAQAIWQGLMIGMLSLIAYFVGSRVMGGSEPNLALGETMAFATLAFSQIIHAFNIRSTHSLFEVGFFTNRRMCGAFAVSLAAMLVVLLIPPLRTVFGLSAMNSAAWLTVAGLSFVPFVVMETYKYIRTQHKKRRATPARITAVREETALDVPAFVDADRAEPADTVKQEFYTSEAELPTEEAPTDDKKD